MRSVIMSAALLCALALPAYAEDDDNLGLRQGQTLLNISAMERAEATQDTLVAHLRVEVEGSDAKKIQNDINETMKKALAGAKALKDARVSTDSYYVYPYDPNPIPEKLGAEEKSEKLWRGAQSMTIEGKNAEEILELTGKLQDMGMLVGGLSYTLSVEKAEEIKDSLMEAAMKKLQSRADRAAAALGRTKTDMVEVNVDASNYFPQPMMMARGMAMDGATAKMETPSAEPGMTEITLTVSARVLLKP